MSNACTLFMLRHESTHTRTAAVRVNAQTVSARQLICWLPLPANADDHSRYPGAAASSIDLSMMLSVELQLMVRNLNTAHDGLLCAWKAQIPVTHKLTTASCVLPKQER